MLIVEPTVNVGPKAALPNAKVGVKLVSVTEPCVPSVFAVLTVPELYQERQVPVASTLEPVVGCPGSPGSLPCRYILSTPM